MKNDIEIVIGNGSLVSSACLSKNEHGISSLIINLSERWLDFERVSGASKEHPSGFISYHFNSNDSTNTDVVTIAGLDSGELYRLEEMEKDQLVVYFFPIKLLTCKTIVLRKTEPDLKANVLLSE